MDPITGIAMSVDHPLINALGVVIHNSFTYAAIVLALLFIGEQRTEKRKKIIFSIVLTILLTTAIKYALAHERPCVGEDWCPKSYSFPSLHTAIAFTLMLPFFDKRGYSFYLLFALFVAFTRLNLGVHVFGDVVAALPIAMVSYYVTYITWKRMGK